MSELKSALERLADLASPPRDPLERLVRRRARAHRNRRIGVAALALVVAVAGVGGALFAFGRSSVRPLPALRHHGYAVEIPGAPLGYEKKGLAIVDAATNLPGGTKVYLYLFSADVESPAEATVKNGRIPIHIWNGFCHQTEAGLEGTTTKVTVIVSPVSGLIRHGGSRIGGPQVTPPPYQPSSVRAILGPNFEKLTGDQVREDDGMRMLVASRVIQLPADTCVTKLLYTQGGSFDQVPVDRPIPVPTGPFPQPPFTSCPDVSGALPVEAGNVEAADEVAMRFDVALTKGDQATLARLADPSVQSLKDWKSSGLSAPAAVENVPSGNYLPSIPPGCGTFVALRTWGVTMSKSTEDLTPLLTYLLILRPDGWKVWGQSPGNGR
jgi:hypothetical protein